jgi:hypothetical protein
MSSEKNDPLDNSDAFSDIDNFLAEEILLDQLKQHRKPAPHVEFDEAPHEDSTPKELPVSVGSVESVRSEELQNNTESPVAHPEIVVRKSIFDDPKFLEDWNKKSMSGKAGKKTVLVKVLIITLPVIGASLFFF